MAINIIRFTLLATFLLSASCAPAAAPPAPTAAPPAQATQPVPAAKESTATPVPVPTKAVSAATPAALSFVDDAGRTVKIPATPSRIVSLAPSNTETLYALGAGDRVVAVTDFDDYPPEVKTKPRVGGMKPSLEKIVAQKPDLVLAAGMSADLAGKLDELKIPVLVLTPPNLAGVYKNIELLGKVTGRESQAAALVASLRARAEAVEAKVKGKARPRVLYEIDASDPAKPFAPGPGSFIDDLIRVAGGANVAADAKLPWAQLSLEEIVKKDPEVIVLGDAIFGVKPEDVKKRPGWSAISAVKKDAIHIIDDNLISKPSPRVVEGLEALAKLVHPGEFR